MPKQTLILDSTQIDTAYECQNLWNYEHHENITLTRSKIDDPKMIGSFGHKLLENYYHHIALGIDIDTSYNAGDRTICLPEYNLSPKIENDIRNKFFNYYLKEKQKRDFLKPLTKQKQVIRISEQGFPIDTIETVPLVEQGFSYKLFESNEYLFILEGKIDLIVEIQGQTCWVDHKIQLRKRNLYKKAIQFKNYSLATGLLIGMINYIRMAKEINQDTFVRELVSFSPIELKCWREELIEFYITLAKSIKNKSFTKNWSACQGRFGYECEFTKLCNEELVGNFVAVEAIKKQEYHQKEIWKPW